LSSTDLWTLGVAAGTQPRLRVRSRRTDSPRQARRAEFFESVARVDTANVRAFSDFERAISWLIMREQSAP
jgi:hypothetical protein